MAAPIRVIIADDHPVVIQGLTQELATADDMVIVGVAQQFREVWSLLDEVQADVLVLDISGMGGAPLTMVRQLHAQRPALKIIIFSSWIDMAAEFLASGAHGYITKEELVTELLLAIRAVHAGRTYRSHIVHEHLTILSEQGRNFQFSPQELSILQLMEQGKGTVEVAQALHLETATVQNYITRLRRKTGSRERTQLVDWYRRHLLGKQ
jgi:DNA-binding NarL/FixJ family response regulator